MSSLRLYAYPPSHSPSLPPSLPPSHTLLAHPQKTAIPGHGAEATKREKVPQGGLVLDSTGWERKEEGIDGHKT